MRAIFTARHLYPIAALLCAIITLDPAALSAADQVRDTSQNARTNMRVEPSDWIGHYMLARREALARHWTTAAAQAGIAWVQRPRSAETTALWTRTAREARLSGRMAGDLPLPTDRGARWAGLLSPFGWQGTGMFGLLLAFGGFGTLLLCRFGHVSRSTLRPAAIFATVGVIVAGSSIASVNVYGPAAANDAAIALRQTPLRALPIDTPEGEARILLAPGTAAHLDRVFIGWAHLRLPDGRSGWLHREDVLPLWQSI